MPTALTASVAYMVTVSILANMVHLGQTQKAKEASKEDPALPRRETVQVALVQVADSGHIFKVELTTLAGRLNMG